MTHTIFNKNKTPHTKLLVSKFPSIVKLVNHIIALTDSSLDAAEELTEELALVLSEQSGIPRNFFQTQVSKGSVYIGTGTGMEWDGVRVMRFHISRTEHYRYSYNHIDTETGVNRRLTLKGKSRDILRAVGEEFGKSAREDIQLRLAYARSIVRAAEALCVVD